MNGYKMVLFAILWSAIFGSTLALSGCSDGIPDVDPDAKMLSASKGHLFKVEMQDGKVGAIDGKGTIVILPDFAGLLGPYEQLDYIVGLHESFYNIFNKQGKLVSMGEGSASPVANDLVFVKNPGLLFGDPTFSPWLFNFKTNDKICKCQDVKPHNDLVCSEYVYNSRYIAVKKADKWGYVNPSGEVLIDFKFDDAENFRDDYAAAKFDGKWGVINTKGEPVIDFAFEEIWERGGPDNQFAVVCTESNRMRVYDMQGNWWQQAEYDLIFLYPRVITAGNEGEPFHAFTYAGTLVSRDYDVQGADSKGIIVKDSHGSHFHLDYSGKPLYDAKFNRLWSFHDGLAKAKTDSDLYGYIDETGSFVIKPQFITAADFNEGLADVIKPVQDGYVHGYINKKGEMAIKVATTETLKEPGVPTMFKFKHGLAKVKTKFWMGYVNAEGSWVWVSEKGRD
ncbi:KWG Leptospira [Anaerohalosphaera lusitana]|uniref:KWG Leptospira n=1 Tax=Anaerohalosphaera lusitana TaxID=1936003 RepID=A0A1U9NIP7_9BACT|nr:WG repeat-containing protein [Anaerohalosphaera lusitana]AQT67791.1 KWG Leptospira [Anaerohalosphaera lusitana]